MASRGQQHQQPPTGNGSNRIGSNSVFGVNATRTPIKWDTSAEPNSSLSALTNAIRGANNRAPLTYNAPSPQDLTAQQQSPSISGRSLELSRPPSGEVWSGADSQPPRQQLAPTPSSSVFDENSHVQFSRMRTHSSTDMNSIEHARTAKKLKDTQYELSSTRTELERKILVLEQQAREAGLIQKKLNARIDKLEGDRRYLYEQEREKNQKIQELEVTKFEEKSRSDEVIKNLREENTNVRERLSRQETQSRATESELGQQIQSLTSSLAHFQQTLADTQGHSQNQTDLASDWHRQLSDALNKVVGLEAENRTLKLNLQRVDDAVQIQRELTNQMTYIKQLEIANRQMTNECRHYKELYQNAEVLRGEKEGLKQKVKMLEELRDRCVKFEIERDLLRLEKDQWAQYLTREDMRDFKSPFDLAKAIASLRGENAALIENQSELQANLKVRDGFIQGQKRHLKDLKTEIEKTAGIYQQEKSRALSHQRSIDLLQRQVVSLQDQLKSYDSEEATMAGAGYDSQKSERIRVLEETLEDYQQRLENYLSSSADSADNTTSGFSVQAVEQDYFAMFSNLTSKYQEAHDAKQALEKANSILEKDVASLQVKIQAFELELGNGAFNPLTTRVLELSSSPAAKVEAIKKSMLDALKMENEALLSKWQQHSMDSTLAKEVAFSDTSIATQSTPISTSVVPTASLQRLQLEFDQLQANMASTEKSAQRMKDLWVMKAESFRLAVHSLLGYKVEFLDDGSVQLVSIYSEQTDRTFIFKSDENDQGNQEFGLQSEKYKKDFETAFKRWVVDSGSIPAFLSQVTLDLVQQHEQQLLQEEGERPPGDESSGMMEQVTMTEDESTMEY